MGEYGYRTSAPDRTRKRLRPSGTGTGTGTATVPESGSGSDEDTGMLSRFGYTVAMHEMGIAIEIYRTCREAVREHGAGRLQRVRIAVGELSAVEPDLLSFGWEAVTVDGPDAGAELEIDFHRADQRCPQCDEAKDRSEGSWLRICPDCGTPLEVRGGDELDVLEVTFVTDDDPPDSGAS